MCRMSRHLFLLIVVNLKCLNLRVNIGLYVYDRDQFLEFSIVKCHLVLAQFNFD